MILFNIELLALWQPLKVILVMDLYPHFGIVWSGNWETFYRVKVLNNNRDHLLSFIFCNSHCNLMISVLQIRDIRDRVINKVPHILKMKGSEFYSKYNTKIGIQKTLYFRPTSLVVFIFLRNKKPLQIFEQVQGFSYQQLCLIMILGNLIMVASKWLSRIPS